MIECVTFQTVVNLSSLVIEALMVIKILGLGRCYEPSVEVSISRVTKQAEPE